jgi:beta-glucosidase-like glycosyl hydrolase
MIYGMVLVLVLGMDQEGGGTAAIKKLPDALAHGRVTNATIDTAFRRLFRARIKLGMVRLSYPHPPYPYTHILAYHTIHAADAVYYADGSSNLKSMECNKERYKCRVKSRSYRISSSDCTRRHVLIQE